MYRINNIVLTIDENENILMDKVSKKLKINKELFKTFEISKKSLDSRDKKNIKWIYSIDFSLKKNINFNKKNISIIKKYKYEIPNLNIPISPVIIGLGPAGLMAGIVLAKAGLKPIIIEQGKDVYQRQKDIDIFWRTGKLNVNSNVQFGAGGAGTFSDGKLTTGTKDPRKSFLLDQFIKFGAPKEIKYLSKPHIGTDNLMNIVNNMCNEIINLGGTIKYSHKFINYSTSNNQLKCITIKDLLIIDYGLMHFTNRIIGIDYLISDYKLSTKTANDIGVYTFCMCPGGRVVNASSEKNHIVTNGMSYYKRNLKNSNSALLVSIKPEDFDGNSNPLNGMYFQRKLEKKAYILGGENYNVPIQTVNDFLNNKHTTKIGKINPSINPGYKMTNLQLLFPKFINESLKEGILNLQKKIDFMKEQDAILSAVETRSSSPITIIRNEKQMSNIYGIYPCGEGAGYAGGIVSAGVDGIRCSESLINEIKFILKK